VNKGSFFENINKLDSYENISELYCVTEEKKRKGVRVWVRAAMRLKNRHQTLTLTPTPSPSNIDLI
jgi:hypothetical protein